MPSALLAVAAALVWFVLRPASGHVHDAPRRIPWPLPDASQAAAAHTILPDGRIYLAIEHRPLPGVTPEMLAAGPVLEVADDPLRGLNCLRALGLDDSADAKRVRAGIADAAAKAPRRGLPIVVIHGLDDGLVPISMTSDRYVPLARKAGAQIDEGRQGGIGQVDPALRRCRQGRGGAAGLRVVVALEAFEQGQAAVGAADQLEGQFGAQPLALAFARQAAHGAAQEAVGFGRHGQGRVTARDVGQCRQRAHRLEVGDLRFHRPRKLRASLRG